jgi:hypothetical protein
MLYRCGITTLLNGGNLIIDSGKKKIGVGTTPKEKYLHVVIYN